MQEEILIQISNKLKIERKARGITIQKLAEKAKVSKALISQIENNRTIPSLLVLINIINSLEIDLNKFFKNISFENPNQQVIIRRKNEYEKFEKEHSPGFSYFRILSKSFTNSLIDIVLLELEQGASRIKMVKTNAFEYKYLIQGSIEYHIKDDVYILEEGDSILFDATLPHRPVNTSKSTAKFLIIYFFNKKNNLSIS